MGGSEAPRRDWDSSLSCPRAAHSVRLPLAGSAVAPVDVAPSCDALSVSRSIVHRKCRHSQCRFHLALPDPEQLPPFDALIVNASSFRGQAKSTVSPLFHESAVHLLWAAGALATCQPTWASLELPSHLKDMQPLTGATLA